MIFCIGEGKYESKGIGYQQNLMIFNQKVSKEVYEQTIKHLNAKDFKLPIAKWIYIKEIEKPTTIQKQMGGYLKELDYQSAWKQMWSEIKSEDKSFLMNLPNFNAEIFEKITGIKPQEEISLKGKKVSVELDGRKYTAIIE